LNWLDQSKSYGKRITEIEYALWFHDAIYKTRSKSNEADSALWARQCLLDAGAQDLQIKRIEALILATQHGASMVAAELDEEKPDAADLDLMLDIDLAILGADPTHFDWFEQQIRREYWWVLPWIYRKARADILQGFLDAPSIYRTAFFHSIRESQARENLQRAIHRLRK
jgi:predicted metal-dependent HD superfamily phosphohydrolase